MAYTGRSHFYSGRFVSFADIITDRLQLRGWFPDDLEHLDAILGDPTVMEFSDWGVLNPTEQSEWLAAARQDQSGLPGILAISRRSDECLLGYVSLLNGKDRLGPGYRELCFRLARHAWGAGYATEAAQGLLNAVSASSAQVAAVVDPNNHRSLGMLDRLGMIYTRALMLPGYDYPDRVYVIPEIAQDAFGG